MLLNRRCSLVGARFALLACGATSDPKAAIDSPEAFRDAILEQIQLTHPDWCVQPVSTHQFNAGESENECDVVSADTSYAFSQFEADRSKQELLVKNFVGSLELAFSSFDGRNQRDNLVVLLRPDGYGTLDVNSAGMPLPVHYDVPRDHDAFLFFDCPTSLRAAQPEAIAELGLEADAVFNLARGNLTRRAGPIIEERTGALLYITLESGLANGLPLLADYCGGNTNTTAILINDRNSFILAPDAKPKAIGGLEGLAASELTSSQTVLTCKDGQWQEQVSAP